MRTRDVGLYLLIILPLVASASAVSGYQQSFGMTSGFSEEDIEDFFGLGEIWEFGVGSTSSMELGSAYSFFSEYYVESGAPIVGGIISAPKKIDIVQEVPTTVYLSGGQQLAYSQYTSTIAPSLPTELWIRGEGAWSQYIACPDGTWLQLIANVPAGGQAEFYEITQTGPNQNSLDYKQYQFFGGYNTMSFQALKTGRHVLMFIINNQPSNVVIVDVFAKSAAVQQASGSMPPASNVPATGQIGSQGAAYGGQYMTGATGLTGTQYSGSSSSTSSTQVKTGSSTKVTYSSTQQTYPGTPTSVPATPITPVSTPAPTSGDTPVTISSNGMRGYQIFLDEVYIGREGTGGDVLDGKFSFRVKGGMNHAVRVYDGQFNYPRNLFFPKGVQKIIYVEPGTAVYI